MDRKRHHKNMVAQNRKKKEIQVLAETIVLSLKTISESYAGYVKFMEVRK